MKKLIYLFFLIFFVNICFANDVVQNPSEIILNANIEIFVPALQPIINDISFNIFNDGQNKISFFAEWEDPNGDDSYITVHNEGNTLSPLVCSSSYSSAALSCTAQLGDITKPNNNFYTFVCNNQADNDGKHCNGVNYQQNQNEFEDTQIFTDSNLPTLSSVTNNAQTYPTAKNIGEVITFTVNWADPDHNNAIILIKRQDDINSNNILCQTNDLSNQNSQTCQYTIENSDIANEQNYNKNTVYAFVCNGISCSTSFPIDFFVTKDEIIVDGINYNLVLQYKGLQ